MRKGLGMFMTSGTYPWSFVTQIFHNGQPSHGGDCKIFEVMTSTLPKGTLGSVDSMLTYGDKKCLKSFSESIEFIKSQL
jgi:hypothetical protein